MATIKFWSEMTKATSVDGQDKVMIGKNSNGEAMYVDFQYLVNQAGAQTSDYIPIDGNTLPTLGTENKFSIVGSGTYTQSVGADVVVPENSLGIIVWDGDEWSIGSFVELPGEPTTDNYDTETSNSLSGIAVGKGISKNFTGGENKIGSAEDVKELNERVRFLDRPDIRYKHYIVGNDKKIIDRLLSEKADGERLLPLGTYIFYVDRPDLGEIIIVDKENRIISHTKENEDNSRLLPEGTSVYYIDRPDLGVFIMVDADDRILGHSGEGNGGGGSQVVTGETQSNFAPWNPPEQDGFSLTRTVDIVPENTNSRLANYDLLIQDYDDLMNEVNVNPNFGRYVSKREIGRSGDGDIPIYLYSFTPPQPKAKILLMAGTHAVEKMYIECIYQFALNFAKDWESNDFLAFLRWNVQIDILPCRSPRTIRNEAGYDTSGVRTIPETAPIPFSWNRTGNTVTLSFDVSDFPDDDLLTGETYFNAVPASALEGKTFISIKTVSDESAIPLGIYRIGTVVSGNSVIFETEDSSGATSGEGTFQVWTDPNRNPSVPNSSSWEDFVPQYRPNTLGTQFTTFDNKGTRPFSLKENRVLLSHCEQENYDLIIDGHADAGDNDIRYDASIGFTPDLERMMAETAAFNGSTNTIRDYTNSPDPLMTIAMTRILGKPFHTIEWGSGFVVAYKTQQRDALRWLGIVLKNNVVQLINNKNK